MKPRGMVIASAVAVTMLAAGCSSGGSGGGTPRLNLEKTNIVVDAFPAIDSAGLYIAQDKGLFAAQGLHVTIVPVKLPPPSTQDLINGQVQGTYDITAGDYVTYIEDQLGAAGAPQHDLRIIAESSFLQPNVLTVLVKGGSPISQVSQLKGRNVSVNAPNDIGTLLIDSLLVAHGLTPRQVHYAIVPFPAVAQTLVAPNTTLSAAFAPEPFVSGGESAAGLQELADLDQGATQDFPIQGYAVTSAWAQKYPNTLKAFTTALAQGQQIADTDRASVEGVIEKYLQIKPQAAAFISLPAFPLGVDQGAAPAGRERDEPVRPAAEEHLLQGHRHDRRLARVPQARGGGYLQPAVASPVSPAPRGGSLLDGLVQSARRKWLMRKIWYPRVARIFRIGRIFRVISPAPRITRLFWHHAAVLAS